MLSFVENLFQALGQPPTGKDGAVGLGSLTIPGSSAIVQRLLSFAAADNSLPTSLGPLKIETAQVRPGMIPRFLVTGTIDGNPFSYAVPIPAQLVDFSAGRPTEFGVITAEGILELPQITYRDGQATVMFDHPIKITKSVDPQAGFIRRRFANYLTTNLLGFKIDAHGGTLILSGVAHWLAPQLVWA